MSRKKNAAWGFIFDVGGTGILQTATFVVTPLYLTYTSPEIYGYWLTIGSVLSWLYLSDFGIGMALLRSAVTAIEENDKERFHNLIRNAIILFSIASVLFFIVGFSFVNVFIKWFEVKPEDIYLFKITYSITILTGALTFPFSVFGAVIQAFQKISFNRIVTSASALFGIGITVASLMLGFGLISFSIGMLVTVTSAALINFLYFKRLLSDFNFLPLRLQNDVAFKLINIGGYFQLGQLANIVALNTDNIIIASFLGAALVSKYALTSKLALLFSVTLISKVPNALFPGLSQLVEQKNVLALKKNFFSLLRISLRIGIISAAFVFIVNEKFVGAWVGPDSYGGTDLTLVWVYLILFDSVIRGITIFVFSFGEIKGWAMFSLAETVLNIGISLLLINSLGLVGVAIGTAIGRTLTIGIYTPLFLKNKLLLTTREATGEVVSCVLKSLPGVIIVIALSAMAIDINIWLWMSSVGIFLLIFNISFFEFPYLVLSKEQSLRGKIMALKSYY